MQPYFVRYSVLGTVARFSVPDGSRYNHGSRVVCRTPRGLEIGEVLSAARDDASTTSEGAILRRVTVEDDLLIARLEKHKQEAVAACSRLLEERGAGVALMDAELLFDGQSLLFYFLGTVPPEIEPLVAELAEAYEGQVQFRKFTDTLTEGCGPGCGTEAATGGGCGVTCVSCSVASICGSKKKAVAT